MIQKEGNQQLIRGEFLKDKGFEMAARILSTLAIEGIFLSKPTLRQILPEQFGLKAELAEKLVVIFGKNDHGENPR